jgi:hypothetical protein
MEGLLLGNFAHELQRRANIVDRDIVLALNFFKCLRSGVSMRRMVAIPDHSPHAIDDFLRHTLVCMCARAGTGTKHNWCRRRALRRYGAGRG